jgi:ribosomal-protein-alanine N-acetyltransferase
VTEKGEAVIVGRWREHLRDCAIFGLWCSPRRVPVIVTDLLEVARDQGFERLVGPLAPEAEARHYRDAGLRVVERVVVMRARPREMSSRPASRLPPGVALREATISDAAEILELDAACFEPFWRYDAPSLTRLMGTERLVLATLDGRSVGYTLSTLRAGDGSLGRLAVTPAQRRRGIGRALAAEALQYLSVAGARNIVLSTQDDNSASRALYRGIGFSETGDVLVSCASGRLGRGTADERW